MADERTTGAGLGQLVDQLPTDRLKEQLRNVASAYAERTLQSAVYRVDAVATRLTDYAETEGGPGLMAALTGAKAKADGRSGVLGMLRGAVTGVGRQVREAVGGSREGGGGTGVKVTNIVEDIDVGVPVRVAYDQWTRFQDWSGFMKKVESVDQEEDEELTFTARIFWSHRTWNATVVEQVPDKRIVWTSSGKKGHVDGTVTFHELAPDLTRILVVLEYHPHGLFERTGNLWRAQGRRARLELKHFRRHVMTTTILDQDEVEGWRGEIRDGEVVTTHEDNLDRERDEDDEDLEDDDDEDLDEDEPEEDEEDLEDEAYDDEPEDDAEPAASRRG